MILLMAGFITTRLESVLTLNPNNSTVDGPSTVFYLRGMGNWRGFVETMGELMMNDVEEKFSPHFFTAYGIYRWSSFRASVAHRANWILPSLEGVFRLVDNRMYNSDDPKSTDGVGIEGQIFPLSWFSITPALGVDPDMISLKFSGIYAFSYHNPDFSGGGVQASLPVRISSVEIAPGFTYFDVKLNNLNQRNNGREFFIKESFSPLGLNFYQGYAATFYPGSLTGSGWIFGASIDREFNGGFNFSAGFSFHSLSEGFRAVLRSSDTLGFGVPYMYLSQASTGTGFSVGVNAVSSLADFRVMMEFFDMSSKEYFIFSRVRIKPFEAFSLRGVYVRNTLEGGESAFFGEVRLRITRRLLFVSNYKRTIRNDANLENIYWAFDFSVYRWARLLVGYGDNGDPESEYYLNDALPGSVSESTVPLYFLMFLLDF